MKCNMGFCALFCLALLTASLSFADDNSRYSEATQHCVATIGTTLAGVDAATFENSYTRRGMASIGKNVRLTYVLNRSKADTTMPKRVVCKFDQRKKVASLKTS